MLTETRLLVRVSTILACVTTLVVAPGRAISATDNELLCGPLANAYGPFDYRTATPDQKTLVEGAHFTWEVETLVRGTTAHQPGGDINYLACFSEPSSCPQVNDGPRVPEKGGPARWFSLARMLCGLYLHKKGDAAGAVAQLETARGFAVQRIVQRKDCSEPRPLAEPAA